MYLGPNQHYNEVFNIKSVLMLQNYILGKPIKLKEHTSIPQHWLSCSCAYCVNRTTVFLPSFPAVGAFQKSALNHRSASPVNRARHSFAPFLPSARERRPPVVRGPTDGRHTARDILSDQFSPTELQQCGGVWPTAGCVRLVVVLEFQRLAN